MTVGLETSGGKVEVESGSGSGSKLTTKGRGRPAVFGQVEKTMTVPVR